MYPEGSSWGAPAPLPSQTHLEEPLKDATDLPSLGVTASGRKAQIGCCSSSAHMSYLRAMLPAQEFVPTSRTGRFCQTMEAGKAWVWIAWYTVGAL